jgi:hypothetical protein
LIPIDKFRLIWKTLMNQEKQESHPGILYKMLHIITNESGNYIDIQKLIKIIDLTEFYPIFVKKDKNFSRELHYVLSSNTKGEYT